MTKISMDKEYTTRQGYEVRVLCVDKVLVGQDKQPVVALVKTGRGCGGESTMLFTEEGFYYSNKAPSMYDLIEKKKEVTINYVRHLVVEEGGSVLSSYANKNFAEAYAKYLRNIGRPCGVATISVPLTVTIE